MSDERKKILMVIAQKGFRDEELDVPRRIFTERGFSVMVAAGSREEAVGKLGMKVMPDMEIQEADFLGYDATVIVGGPGSKDYLWDNGVLLEGLSNAYAAGRAVCAICISPVVLAKAGVLKGKRATVFPDDEGIAELKEAGAEYHDRNVIADGNVITGRDPHAAKDFAVAIINLLLKGGIMDSQKVIETLKKISLDCDRIIKEGFRTDLNVLTIRKQLDGVLEMLGADEKKEPETERTENVAEPQVKEMDAGEVAADGMNAEKKEAGDLAGEIDELSKEVAVQKDSPPQEALKQGDEPKKLESTKQEPAQPLKQSSSVTEKTA